MRAVCVLDVCRIWEIPTYCKHTGYIRHGGWCNNGKSKAKRIRWKVRQYPAKCVVYDNPIVKKPNTSCNPLNKPYFRRILRGFLS